LVLYYSRKDLFVEVLGNGIFFYYGDVLNSVALIWLLAVSESNTLLVSSVNFFSLKINFSGVFIVI